MTMGFAVANQRVVSTRRISGIGETLEVLIIGTLFILLGALVDVGDLTAFAGEIVLIVATLVLVVRPLAAAVSLLRTPLTGRERALAGWMDPRGIVAAATASQFAGPLNEAGSDADFLLPVTFGVILGTGVIYGLTAKPVAALLDVAQPPPTGVGLVGDDAWLVPFGRCLAGTGVKTLLVTTEPVDADERGPAEGGSTLTTTSLREGTGHILQAVRETSLGSAVFAVDAHAALSLIGPHLIELLGRRHVQQPPRHHPHGVSADRPATVVDPHARRGAGRADIADRFRAGASVQVLSASVPENALVLALVLAAVRPDGRVRFDLDVTKPVSYRSAAVIALVDPTG